MTYHLICIAPDGDHYLDSTFFSFDAARNAARNCCNDIDSPWVSDPTWVVVDENDVIVATDDNTPDLDTPIPLGDFISKFTE
jgi:hypothetical protein